MARIGLVTSDFLPDLTDGDRLLGNGLARLGHAVRPVIWTAQPGDDCDLLILRSCWDYHLQPERFVSWATSAGNRLVNRLALIEWNIDKRYLLDLYESGVPIVPTRLVDAGQIVRAGELMEALGCAALIVKPTVGAGAHELRRVESPDEPIDGGKGGVLVQPLMAEVLTEGEWSITVIAGEATHAVLKRPAEGDLRVQEEHGGTTIVAEAPQGVLDLARFCMGALAEVPLYARIDVVDSSNPRLMELELIEPELFFPLSPSAAEAMAQAVHALALERGLGATRA